MDNIVAKSMSVDSLIVEGSSIGNGQVITRAATFVASSTAIKSGAIVLPVNALITNLSFIVTTAIVKGSGTLGQRVGTEASEADVCALVSNGVQASAASPVEVGRGNSTNVGLTRSASTGLKANTSMVILSGKAFYPDGGSIFMEVVNSSGALTAGACNFVVEFIVL